jgi:hypothetical protein
VWEVLKKDKSPLGWSSSEKGKIIPLFIALLTGSKPLEPCAKKMIADSYEKQFDSFVQVLTESLKSLSDADYQDYYAWCLNETSGRVDAIVKNQHRGSYYKASALVVSIAEIIRSKGDNSAATAFINGYKEKYPRHTALHRCLRDDIQLTKFGKLF